MKTICKAKNPLTCPYHGLATLDPKTSSTIKTLTPEEEKKQFVDKYYKITGLNFTELKKWFECGRRPAITDQSPSTAMTTPVEGKTIIEICPQNPEHKHIYTSEYFQNKNSWTTEKQFNALEAYVRDVNSGKIKDKQPIKIEPNAQVDILFHGAIAYNEEIGLSREELFTWYVCGRKLAHPNQEQAMGYITPEKTEQGYNTYKCPYGNHYHVGRARKHTNTLNKNNQMYAKAKKTFKTYSEHNRLKPELIKLLQERGIKNELLPAQK